MVTDRRRTTRDRLALAMLFSTSFAGTLAFEWHSTPAIAEAVPQATASWGDPFQATTAPVAGMELPVASAPEYVEASIPEPTLSDLAASDDSAIRAEAQAVLGVLAEESQSL